MDVRWHRAPRDYLVAIIGAVVDESGTPIADADVSVETQPSVYVGTESSRVRRATTNSTGGFVLALTTHLRDTSFRLTVRKDGFGPRSVDGSGPGEKHYTITLTTSR
jgi:hypothetical protein